MTAGGSRQADEVAIGELLLTLARGFRELDATGLDEIYADDADWTNAFGTSRHGRDAIIAYLNELFGDPRFAAGKVVGRPEVSVRFASDDVAVVRTYIEREGQQVVGGGELPRRRNHSLKVLVKRDGRWLILSDMYMDAREEQTLAAAS